jgi:hypothetical protein
MLLKKPLAVNDVATFKLNNGEEIICTVTDISATGFTVRKPVSLVPGPQGGMGFAPWIMTTEADTFTLNNEQILASGATQAEIAKSYTEAVSDIQLV